MRPMIKLIKVGQKLSLEELEDLLNQAYEAGYEDGKKESKTYYYPYYPYNPSPSITWSGTNLPNYNPYEITCKDGVLNSNTTTSSTISILNSTDNSAEYIDKILDSAAEMFKATDTSGTVTFTKTSKGFKVQDTVLPFDSYTVDIVQG